MLFSLHMISKLQLSQQLKAIISEVANVPAVTIKNTTDLQKDLGIDSFNATEILVAVEHKYKITIDPLEVFNLKLFKDVILLMEKYLLTK